MKNVRDLAPADEKSVRKGSINIKNFNVWFGNSHVLHSIDLQFSPNSINCVLGPSGSGKSTLIRSINRINDDIDGYRTDGNIYIDGEDIHSRGINVVELRKKVGMVFQKPCVFPVSVLENVLFGIKHLKLPKTDMLDMAEKSLKKASLWKEVNHRLDKPARELSVGQQQRVCLARTLAVDPEILLLDEPTSSLDPIATREIEDTFLGLKEQYTMIFVTHNINQAKRISDTVTFLCNGEVIESGSRSKIFLQPEEARTRQYLNEEYCDC